MATAFKIPSRLIEGSDLDLHALFANYGYAIDRRTRSSDVWTITVVEDVPDETKARIDTAIVTALNHVGYELGYSGESTAHAKARYKQVMDLCVASRLANEGFEHPAASGRIFSLSIPAQIKWIGLVISKDSMTYPYTVPVLDDSEVYAIADAAEVLVMWGAIMTQVATVLGQATAQKTAIEAAADKAAARTSAVTHLESNNCEQLVALLGP